jgi:catechol 2,3-dioxygenase-like lactoylglutathione lyase family enzyme
VQENKIIFSLKKMTGCSRVSKNSNMDNNTPADPFQHAAISTILVVNDVIASKNFYTSVLGAEIFREYGGNTVVLKFLQHWLLLVSAGEPTTDKPHTCFCPPSDRYTVSHSFTIRVMDCNASYEILKQRGADFLTPPLKQGAETRCFFYDPDGHLFEISAYKE